LEIQFDPSTVEAMLMLIDPQIILARLERYPNLSTCTSAYIRRKLVRSATDDPSIAAWHVFFEEEAIASAIIGNIDNVLGHLRQKNVEGLKACAERLCSPTQDGFWSGFTELVQGSKLCVGYPVRYVPKRKDKRRTPDIEVRTSGGPVYVEITSMQKTWDFHAIERSIRSALGNLRHAYRINVKCPSDTVKIAEASLKELTDRIKAHIVVKPFPADSEDELMFDMMDRRITVSLQRSDLEGCGYVVTSTDASARQGPEAHFRRIVKRLSDDKAFQMENYRPAVVIIELANDSSGIANLGWSDPLWAAYGPLFRVEEIPSTVDLVILTWQDIYGKTWGHARALRNPNSPWAQTSEAERIYRLIAA
jgi:hypothetical protein